MISRSSSWLLGMMTVLLISLGFVLSAASPSCARRADMALNSMYSEDHLNYLCMNYSRPTPLPCRPVIEKWKPRWWDGEKRKRKFVIYAWWPPAPEEIEAYGMVWIRHGSASEGCQGRGAYSMVWIILHLS